MNKKILRSKEAEIAKAGRLVFDAIFGDSREFQKNLEEEMDREASGDADAVVVEGHSFVRCSGCGREQKVPPHVDVRVVEQHGWRFASSAWRCPFCVGR
jgi:uncharacterized protein with PIN domain